VELARLVAIPDLNLRLRTGDLGQARPIAWVHTTELVDPAPWLEGGELLLTTGLQLRNVDQAETFVERVADAEVAAVGFGIAPVHDAVPVELLEAATRRGLPVIELPSTTPFIAVSRAVGAWWAEQQTGLFRRLISSQRSIAQGALSPDAEREVVRRLAEELGCWAVLTGGRTSVVAGSPGPDVERWLREQSQTPRSASTRRGEQSVLLHKVSGADRSAQLAVGRDTPFGSEERSLVLIAEALLSAAAVSGSRASEDLLSGLAVQLLVDGQVGACWRVAGVLYGDQLPSQWRAVAEAIGPGDGVPSTHSSSSPRLVTAVGDQRIWLVPADAATEVLEEIERRRHAGGYSEEVSPAQAQQAVEDARRALALATSHGKPRLVGPEEIKGHGPLALATEDQLRAAENVLEPLRGDRRGDTLMRSLLVWFEEGTRWDPAAARLGIHRHTLRQRLEVAFERLDRDMENPRDRLELWTSLSLLEWQKRSASNGQPPA
jgi:purine catabolism regulator